MGIKITGLDEVKKNLDNLSRKAKEVDGTHQVGISELMPDRFIQTHTGFNSVQEMYDKSGFKMESEKDLETIPDEEWDKYISDNTQFSNWQEMLDKAGELWVSKKLGF